MTETNHPPLQRGGNRFHRSQWGHCGVGPSAGNARERTSSWQIFGQNCGVSKQGPGWTEEVGYKGRQLEHQRKRGDARANGRARSGVPTSGARGASG